MKQHWLWVQSQRGAIPRYRLINDCKKRFRGGSLFLCFYLEFMFYCSTFDNVENMKCRQINGTMFQLQPIIRIKK